MSARNMFSSSNKKNIDTFWLKKKSALSRGMMHYQTDAKSKDPLEARNISNKTKIADCFIESVHET